MAVMKELLCLGEKKEEQELMVGFEHFFCEEEALENIANFCS